MTIRIIPKTLPGTETTPSYALHIVCGAYHGALLLRLTRHLLLRVLGKHVLNASYRVLLSPSTRKAAQQARTFLEQRLFQWFCNYALLDCHITTGSGPNCSVYWSLLQVY